MFWPLPFGLWLTMSQSREELNSQEILQFLATLRICDQPREVCPYPKSHHSILGHHGGLMMISLSQRNERHGQRLPLNTTARDPFCLRSIKYDRSNVSQIEGSIISSCLHSFKATVTLDHTVKEQLVWSVNDLAGKSNPRPHSENRCIPSGLGCSFRRSSYWQTSGSLWSVEEWVQHINYTELTAGALVVRTFAKHKMECQCTLRIDNKIEIFLDATF